MYSNVDQLRFDVITKLEEAKKENKELIMTIKYSDGNMFQTTITSLDEKGNILTLDQLKFDMNVLIKQLESKEITKIRLNIF